MSGGILDIFLKKSEYFKVNNPHNSSEMCELLINNKKTKYYVHTYDPDLIINNIGLDAIQYNIDDETKLNYIKNIREMIETESQPNCCNCVSFVLYNFDSHRIDNFYNFMKSLFISVNNITNYLSGFIVRLYFDQSVFDTLNIFRNNPSNFEKYKYKINRNEYKINQIDQILEYLYTNERTEIYLYGCPSNEKNDDKIRSLRFLPLFDKTVNIKIIRDADGFVSCTDCFNILKFVRDKKILMNYSMDLLKSSHPSMFLRHDALISKIEGVKNNICTLPYSPWLKIYHLHDEFLSSHVPLFDIAAGLFGTSIQIKSTYYDKCRENVDNFINNVKNVKLQLKKLIDNFATLKSLDKEFSNMIREQSYNTFTGSKIKQLEQYNNTHDSKELNLIIQELKLYDEKYINSILSYIYNHTYFETETLFVNIGYDEIFLLELFKNISCVKRNIDTDETILNFIKTNMNLYKNPYTLTYWLIYPPDDHIIDIAHNDYLKYYDINSYDKSKILFYINQIASIEKIINISLDNTFQDIEDYSKNIAKKFIDSGMVLKNVFAEKKIATYIYNEFYFTELRTITSIKCMIDTILYKLRELFENNYIMIFFNTNAHLASTIHFLNGRLYKDELLSTEQNIKDDTFYKLYNNDVPTTSHIEKFNDLIGGSNSYIKFRKYIMKLSNR